MGDNRISVEGLEDANLAGTERARDCTLVLTAGKVAASIVAAGIAVVGGRDTYGIYAIGGDMINARKNLDETRRDRVVNAIRTALGLEFVETYEDDNAFQTLRYGKVMLVAGQEANGSIVKGLVVNLFHTCWPYLLQRQGFLVQLITPAVKVFHSGGETRFYSLDEFRQSNFYRLEESEDSHVIVREYRSIESVTSEEMRRYFSHLNAHCVHFRYGGEEDRQAIESAFDADEDRKTLLQESLEGAQLEDSHLYYEGIREITYRDFIYKEYSLYCGNIVERAIPSVMDGLTRNKRKVLHTCLGRYPDKEVSVLQLVGSVFEVSAYRNSSEALGDTIIRMAQDFVGKGNVNLLMPLGQFGTRIKGGEDAGSFKYLHTRLNGVTRFLFPPADLGILENCRERGRAIEPQHYLPVIPLILVNGASGFGPGWKTKIPNYHPMDVVENLLRMLDGGEPVEMTPWFRHFDGTVERLNDKRFRTLGKIEILDRRSVKITELPVGSWTHKYRKDVLDRMTRERSIVGYVDRHTDTTVEFVVTLANDLPERINNDDLYTRFKLVENVGCTFTAYDHLHTLKSFENATEILQYFFDVRLEAYEDRRQHMMQRFRRDLQALHGLDVQREGSTIRIEYRGERVSIQRERIGSTDEPNERGGHGSEARRILGNLWRFTESQWENLERSRQEAESNLALLESVTASELWKMDLYALLQRPEITLDRLNPMAYLQDNADGLAQRLAILEL